MKIELGAQCPHCSKVYQLKMETTKRPEGRVGMMQCPSCKVHAVMNIIFPYDLVECKLVKQYPPEEAEMIDFAKLNRELNDTPIRKNIVIEVFDSRDPIEAQDFIEKLLDKEKTKAEKKKKVFAYSVLEAKETK